MNDLFTNVERDEWGTISVNRDKSASSFWRAQLWVDQGKDSPTGRPGHLQFTTEGLNPDEAVARLEQAVIETLAQGGQLEERRQVFPGRRAYDHLRFHHQPLAGRRAPKDDWQDTRW